MDKFQHFIITPFNVDIGVKPRDYILGKEYLETRLELFQEVCYKGAYNQSNHNFIWLLFIDRETPDIYKKTLNKLSKWKCLKIIFTDANLNFHPFLVKTIQEKLQPDTEFLITSILDCDDGLNVDYIKTIQDNFREQDFEFINFPCGYLLRKDGLFLRQYISSPFISLIERINEPIITSKVMSHSYLFNLSKSGLSVKQIFTDPIWLQVVHDHNLLTSYDINSVLQSPNQIKNDFIFQDFIKSYITVPYYQSLKIFLENKILKNNYKIGIEKRIMNLFFLINPLFPKIYLWLTLKSKRFLFNTPKLSVSEMKSLCLQQPSYWRKKGDLNTSPGDN